MFRKKKNVCFIAREIDLRLNHLSVLSLLITNVATGFTELRTISSVVINSVRFLKKPECLRGKGAWFLEAGVASPHVPEAEIERAELRKAHDPLQSRGRDARASVQVDATQVQQRVRDGVQPLVRDAVALADVERLQVVQRLRHPADAFVRHLTRAQRQRPQVEQSLGYVNQRLVADLVAETHVQVRDSRPTLGQIRHSDVRDVVARAQVEFAQRRHLGQVLEARVGDGHAEAEVDAFESGEARGYVLERLVGQPLTVLQPQVLQGQVTVSRVAVEPRQVADALVGHVPAGAQVESAQLAQPPRYQQQPRVGDVAAAAQFQNLQVLEVLSDATETGVRHLFAQGQVQLRQRRRVRHERVRQTDVCHIVATQKVQGLQVRYAHHNVPQRATNRKHLQAKTPHQYRPHHPLNIY